MVGIALANAGLVGLRELDQHGKNRWQLRCANVICQRWARKTADKMSTLAQRMTAFWDELSH